MIRQNEIWDNGCSHLSLFVHGGHGSIVKNPGLFRMLSNAGDPEFVPYIGETDIDLEPRIMGLRVDIGADEFLSTPTPVIGISPKLFVFNADEGRSDPNVQSLFVFSASGFG